MAGRRQRGALCDLEACDIGLRSIERVDVPPQHREFASEVEASGCVDPMPTFRALSCGTGVPVDALVHHALVRWASAGAEALMSVEPQIVEELVVARRQEDWRKVAGIIDWLDAGR